MIKILPERVINQIAAGEVVERPSSVVKELVDNALDAGATKITVALIGGGQSGITVTDNGIGMSRDDALLSFERHATSKIAAFADLESLSTNGFRGEALPSIASISKVEMTSRREEDEVATKITISGGKVQSVESVSSGIGTSISVRSLFFNVPARKKFLKSQRSDEIKVQELLCAYGLAYPTIDLELILDGISKLILRPHADLVSRATKIIKGGTVAVYHQFDEVTVTGVLAHPSQAVSEGASLTILVNKRFVSDRFILRAVKEGFSSTLKDKEFPVGVIAIELPGQFVDVNVHPQKSEVRFSNTQKIFAAVKIAVEEGIRSFRTPLGFQPIQSFVEKTSEKSGIAASGYSAIQTSATSFFVKQGNAQSFGTSFVRKPSIAVNDGSSLVLETPSFSIQSEERNTSFHDWRYLGQIFACYLLFDTPNSGFYIVDMHAAHERLNYNRIRKAVEDSHKKIQKLLIPEKIFLSENEREELSIIAPHLRKLGYGWEEYETCIELVEIPSLLSSINHRDLLKKTTSKETYGEFPFALEETIAYICARLACHASVRSGRILHRDEAYALLEQMESADFATACPHGRPCVVAFRETDIEQWFGRDR